MCFNNGFNNIKVGIKVCFNGFNNMKVSMKVNMKVGIKNYFNDDLNNIKVNY